MEERKPKIIVAGMFDTKYTELNFLAEEVARAAVTSPLSI